MAAADLDAVAAADPLLRRGPAAAVCRLGAPLALGLASHALLNLVDLLMVGRLGAEAIQAAHVATTWNFLPMIVGNCISTALLARLSRHLGRGEPATARAVHRRAEALMLWLGALVAVATALPSAWVVDATGLRGAVRDQAVHYLAVSNLGCLPMFVLMQTTAAMRAAGEALVPLLLLLFANLLNLLLAWLLLFGCPALGVPAVGVVGAAYAAVVARALAAGLAVAWLWRRRHPLSLRGGAAAAPAGVLRELCRDAWPQVLQIGLRAGLVIALTVVVQRRFGDAVTVALGITTRLDTVVLFTSLGFANAATAYAGRAVVVGRAAAARAAGFWAGAQAAAVGALLVWLGSRHAASLCEWFLPGAAPAVGAAVADYLGLAAWSNVFGAAALGAIGAAHGAGSMRAPLAVDLVGFAATAALLAAAAAAGGSLPAIYRALVLGMAALALLHGLHTAFGRWARPV